MSRDIYLSPLSSLFFAYRRFVSIVLILRKGLLLFVFSKFDSKASNEGLLSVFVFVVAGLSLWVEYQSTCDT